MQAAARIAGGSVARREHASIVARFNRGLAVPCAGTKCPLQGLPLFKWNRHPVAKLRRLEELLTASKAVTLSLAAASAAPRPVRAEEQGDMRRYRQGRAA